MIFNIFQGEADKESLKTKKGFKPYVKKAGLFGSKSYLVDELSGKANALERAYMDMSSEQQDTAIKYMDEQMATWKDAVMVDTRDEFVQRRLSESKAAREGSIDTINQATSYGKRPSSTSEARQLYSKRIEGFKRARAKLRQAGQATGDLSTKISYNETGYEMLDPDMDKFYAEFDAAIEGRKQEYAEIYGFDDYSDLAAGYSGMWKDKTEQELSAMDDDQLAAWEEAKAKQDAYGIGQQDIDALILGDIMGMSLYDLAFLETADVDFSVGESMGQIRENFGDLYKKTIEGSNQAAAFENENRMKLAKKMEAEKRKTIAQLQENQAESIAEQQSSIRDAERSAKKSLDKQMESLTDMGPARRKKVKGLDFNEGRPS